ncbi:MAG: vanadium-dependent haloperoxidase [Mariniphaga sp.]
MKKTKMKTKLIFILFFYCGYVNAQNNKPLPGYLELQPHILSLSMVMMHDVVNPPAASRFYNYALLGAYEIVCQNNPSIVPLSSLIKNYTPFKIEMDKRMYDHRIAAVLCILETGKKMLPSGFMLQESEDKYLQNLKKNKLAQKIIDASLSVADLMSESIVSYAKTDGYSKLSSRLRYTPLRGDGFWYPTPPAYMEAVEPQWKTIRPMLIDSSNQFVPIPPVAFSKDSSSTFYKLAKEVYYISKSITPEQLEMASFWDCNPFVVSTSGHMMIGFKKISPGGHWMNIASVAAKTAKLNFDSVIVVHTMVSMTLVDAFISCWDEKYRSNRIRPETYINKYIDIKWQPLLQTPPFPEYTSGHSVISTAAAEVLTYLLGNEFYFVDDSEEIFELKPRHFNSFREAASEAAISRFYGGIHYMDAIENGQKQGALVGQWIVQKLSQKALRK